MKAVIGLLNKLSDFSEFNKRFSMNIVVDVMGGDLAPFEMIKGSIEALENYTGIITLCGNESKIKEELKKYTYDSDKIKILDAQEVITNDESPVKAIRSKKNSPMVVGINYVKEGKADAFVSAGSTGALLTGGLLISGRIKGIDRPALSAAIPTKKNMTTILDSGANVDCKVMNIVQFAKIGSIYLEKVMGINKPKVGLLNIGAEEEKGNALTKEAYLELKNDKSINFIGNVEGRDVSEGVADLIVCDGFAGNVLLKTYEGVAMFLLGMLKEAMFKNTATKMGAMLLKGSLKELKNKIDYGEVGGAPLLGVNHVIIKAHGSSDAKAFKNAIMQAEKFVKSNYINELKSNIYVD